MAYLPKRAVLANVAERRRPWKNGVRVTYDAYLGYDPYTGRQRRLSSSDPKKLRRAIDEFYAARSAGGDAAASLSADEAHDARRALDALAAAGARMSLEEAVRCALSPVAPQGGGAAGGKSVGEAYDEYLSSFSLAQVHHVHAVRTRVGAWAEAFGRSRPLSDVCAREVGAWLASAHGGSNKTYNNHLTYVRTFLNWCAGPERGWLAANPLAGMRTRAVAYREPAYVGAADAARLFRALEAVRETSPETLAYAVLSFFCGVRREEVLRMASSPDAANVNLEDETVRVALPKGWTKGVAPRAFPLLPNALAWMRSFPFADAVGRITEKTTDRLKCVARAAGLSLPRNAGRHTFITMHVAAFRDPARTEALAGTSRKMRVSSYCGLASKKDGEAYFAIMPSRSAE